MNTATIKPLRAHLIQAFYDRSSPDTLETAERAADEFLARMDEGMKRAWYHAMYRVPGDDYPHEWTVCYDANRQDFYLRDLLEEDDESADWDAD